MERLTQVPLSITDDHRRALAFQAITEGLADYAQAIQHAGDVFTLLRIHKELKVLGTALQAMQDRAIDTADRILED